MTPVDDLKIGRWYAIKAEREEESQWTPFGMFGGRRESAVDGTPLRLLAISLPFVIVTNGEQRFPLDVRKYDLIRLDTDYVKAITPVNREYRQQDKPVFMDQVQRKREKPDPRLCPCCHEGQLKQVYRNSTSRGYSWSLVCEVCGFEGKLPESGGKV